MTTQTEKTKFRDMLISDDALENSIDWIKLNLAPDEVFDDCALDEWAENNGYVKEE